MGISLLGLIDREETMSTVEMKINYLKSFTNGEIFAESRIIHKGGNTAVGDVEIKDSDNNIIARGLGTYIIIKKGD